MAIYPITNPDTQKAADPRWKLWLLLLGTALLSFWSLGSLPLVDVDEPVYGQVGREMAGAGWEGWLTPHLGGQLWFDKPPLFYWLTALSMKTLGVSEFSARLPSAVLAVGLVALTFALARRAFPDTPRAGLWAGFVLATCVQFFLLARAAVTDMTLALTLTGALFGLYQWTRTRQGQWIVLAGAMTGLAALAKGPVALVLIGVQTIAYLLLTRQPKRLLVPALWGGFLVCLAVGLPWYLAMIRLHGALFVDGFLEANNVTRFLEPEHRSTSSPLFFLPVLIGGFFPWSLALPMTAVLVWRQGRDAGIARQADNPMLFLGLWAMLVFVFFSASQSKLVTYIFPLYPALAVLVGVWLAKAAETFAARVALGVYAALAVGLGAALWAAGAKFGVAPVTLALWAFVLFGSAALALGASRSQRPWAWLVPGTAIIFVLLLAWISPTWRTQEPEVSDRRLAQAASAAALPGEPIYSLGLKHPSLRFYATHPVVYVDDHAAAAHDLQTRPGVVYTLRPEVLDELHQKYGLTHDQELARFRRTVLVRGTAPP